MSEKHEMTASPHDQAVVRAAIEGQKDLGIEGDDEIQLWHLLLSIRNVAQSGFDELLRDVERHRKEFPEG